jgi:hypothetical protein
MVDQAKNGMNDKQSVEKNLAHQDNQVGRKTTWAYMSGYLDELTPSSHSLLLGSTEQASHGYAMAMVASLDQQGAGTGPTLLHTTLRHAHPFRPSFKIQTPFFFVLLRYVADSCCLR